METLVELEQQGWQALSTEGDAGEFYASILREDAVMLPGGIRIDGRERILQSFGSQPWENFLIENTKVIPLDADAATLVYNVTAQRKGGEPYAALISSTYVRDGGWKLIIHQQTPAN